MANINTYTVESVRVDDKIVASDGISGATKNLAAGDIAELAGCKVYRAFLTQTGTNAPVVTLVGTNTIGNLVCTRVSTGQYIFTLINAFVGNATAVIGLPKYDYAEIRGSKTNSDAYTILTYNTGVLSDGLLIDQYIELRVY
jgi:hypothetical protein